MTASGFIRIVFAALLFVTAFPAAAAGAQTERELARVFEALDANKRELAMQRVEALIAANPNFRLAHLIRGDLLMARTRPLATFSTVTCSCSASRMNRSRRITSWSGASDPPTGLRRKNAAEKYSTRPVESGSRGFPSIRSRMRER